MTDAMVVGKRSFCSHATLFSYEHTPTADRRYVSDSSWSSMKSATSALEILAVRK